MKQEVIKFVKECAICQKNKAEHTPYPGLLQPLPAPDLARSHITIDFMEGLPKSKDKDVILIVVDRLTKYAHFISLKHPYTIQQVAKLFSDHIFKLRGLPSVIVTNRDRIFISQLWQELFKSLVI